MSLPISIAQAVKASSWLKKHFGDQIKEFTQNTPWTVDLICAIACQETAYKWLLWIDKYPADVILQRCVFDASGDFPGTSRNAFPRNKIEFQNRYGAKLTEMLIYEGNETRAMPQVDNPKGYKPAGYLYKGYGIFQNDLQNILTDRSFFEEKKWYNMSDCLQKLVLELNNKARVTANLKSIVKAYNGSGSAAEQYSINVLQYYDNIKIA